MPRLNMLTNIVLLLAIASTLLLLSNHRINALSCLPPDESPLEFMQRADAVFVGSIQGEIQTEKPADSRLQNLNEPDISHYNVRVADSIKGPATNEQVKVYVDSTWGSTNLEKNQDYLMILVQSDENYREALCEPIGITSMDNPRVAAYVDEFDNVNEIQSNRLFDFNENRVLLAGITIAVIGFSSFALYSIRKKTH